MAARSGAIAHVVTAMMKKSGRWCAEGSINFSLRKQLARRSLDWVFRYVELVEVSPSHIERASELWFAYYREELHQQRAGFDDYVDAALVMAPPADPPFAHVLVDHNHLPYVLGKSGRSVTPHYLPEVR